MHDDLIARLRDASDLQEMYKLCDEAADALESMQADAARYRWLRGNYNETLDLVQALQLFTPEGLDAAIDAARGGGMTDTTKPALPEPVAWLTDAKWGKSFSIDKPDFGLATWKAPAPVLIALYTADQLRAYGDARAAALAGVLRLVVGDAEMFCRAAHHSKADRHEAFEPCPIHTRAVAALQEQKS